MIETQARRPVSVKVKQFSLQGARIQNDWQGPQMVKYKNKVEIYKQIEPDRFMIQNKEKNKKVREKV